jgi:Fe(3+) dicitrate transport protein
MKKIIQTLIAVSTIIQLAAQTGNIEGIVLLSDSLNTLPGVHVYLEKTNIGTTTNGNGYYSLKGVPSGKHVLHISSIGFLPVQREVTVEEGKTLALNVALVEAVSTLGDVVVMVKGNRGLKDIPGSVQYISPKEIQKFSYTDINRTLRGVPGINIQEEDGFGLRPNIGLRGTGVERSAKITIMEDGVLMAPAPYADPSAYYFPTIGRMQGIEILKGSSQIKYGPFTTGGAINLLSTQIPESFSGRFDLLGGSFGGRNLHASVGNALQNFAYLVESFQYSSDGFKKLDGGGNTGFDKKDYLAKFRINTNPDANIYQSLTFKWGQVKEASNETYLGLTESDFAATPYRRYAASQKDLMQTSQSQYSLTHLVKFSKMFQISTTAYRTDFSRNWYKLDKVADSTGAKTGISDLLADPSSHPEAIEILQGSTSTNDNALALKANNRDYYAQGVQSVLSANYETGSVSHDVSVGFRYHEDQVDRFQWVDEYSMNEGTMQLTKSGLPGTESNRLVSANAVASYVQYKLKFQQFTVTPGIRYENITLQQEDFGKNDPDRTGVELVKKENKEDVFIPGIGIDYQFSRYLSAFAGVHKGFSPPGPNDATVPEESVNYELGARYTKNAFSTQAVVFFNDYSNLLGSDLAASGGSGTGDLFNGGEVQTRGLEFQLSCDLLSGNRESPYGLPVSVAYTYTDAVFQNSFQSTFEEWGGVAEDDQFPYLATHQFTFIAGLEHHQFTVNLSGRYLGEMRTSPGQGEIPANEKIGAHFVVDASASYLLHKNISLFANATNLLDEVYLVARRPAGLRPGMPRAFNVGMKARF